VTENQLVMAVAVIFVFFLGALTVGAAVETGASALTVISLLIFGLLLVGVVGAIRHDRRD
jgi:hypothetical protein